MAARGGRWSVWFGWLRPPDLLDPEDRERAAFLHVLMLATQGVVVLALVALALSTLEGPDKSVGIPLTLFVLGLNALGLAAIRRGRVRLVAFIYCALIVLVLTLVQVMFGANPVMLTAGLVNITFVVGYSVGGAAALAFGLAVAAWVAATMWLTVTGQLPLPPYGQRPVDTAVQAGGPLVVTAVLIAFGLARLRATARQARAGQRALVARAREGELIGDLGQRVVQMQEADEFAEQVVGTIIEAVDVQCAAVYRCAVDRLQLASAAGPVVAPAELRVPVGSMESCLQPSQEARPMVLDAARLAECGCSGLGQDACAVLVTIPRRAAHGGCLLAIGRSRDSLEDAPVSFLRACATLLGAAADRVETDTHLRHAQKLEAIGQLAGGVAHDFNNLLTGILGSAELAVLGLDPSHPVVPLLQDISRAGEHAALLTRQLLVQSRKERLRPEVVDLREVLNALEGILTRLMGENIELRTPTPGSPALVFTDRSALEQIVLNLCLNARDAVGRAGRIDLDVAIESPDPLSDSAHDTVVLSVEDDGCGMDESTRAHIFEPFFTTKGPDHGTGLGLATVHSLVREFGGEIGVRSQLGAGSRFEVRFPRAPVETPETSLAETSRGPSGQGELVLLVEDHDLARRALERTLKRNGYEVLTANDGAQALATMEQRKDVSIIVSDITMPNISGDELLHALRSRGQDTPVVFLSGYPSTSGRGGRPVTTLDAPLLAKPVATDELLRTLRTLLGGGARSGLSER